jgi:eukaryotic-like serine/threonine-protein kinase
VPPEPGPSEVPTQQLRQACAELEQRLRAGEDCRAEEFLATLPALASDADAVLELLYTEFVVREQLGQEPSVAAWYARFPQWQPDLQQLLQVHQFMCRRSVGSVGATLLNSGKDGPPAADLPLGRLGNYELLGELGRGAAAWASSTRRGRRACSAW